MLQGEAEALSLSCGDFASVKASCSTHGGINGRVVALSASKHGIGRCYDGLIQFRELRLAEVQQGQEVGDLPLLKRVRELDLFHRRGERGIRGPLEDLLVGSPLATVLVICDMVDLKVVAEHISQVAVFGSPMDYQVAAHEGREISRC